MMTDSMTRELNLLACPISLKFCTKTAREKRNFVWFWGVFDAAELAEILGGAGVFRSKG